MRGSYNSYVTVEGGLSVMPNRRPLARPFRRNGKPVSSTHSQTSTRTHALTHRSLHIFTWPIDCEMRTALRTAFLSVLCQLLLWAGEHTHTTRYGSVDGAMATGEREAKKIIRYKRNKWWPMETDQLQNRSWNMIVVMNTVISFLHNDINDNKNAKQCQSPSNFHTLPELEKNHIRVGRVTGTSAFHILLDFVANLVLYCFWTLTFIFLPC